MANNDVGLHALHSSVRKRVMSGQAVGIKPKGMSGKALGNDLRIALEELTLSIFTDMTNAGATLQATLTAIYLTGAENAIAIHKEK